MHPVTCCTILLKPYVFQIVPSNLNHKNCYFISIMFMHSCYCISIFISKMYSPNTSLDKKNAPSTRFLKFHKLFRAFLCTKLAGVPIVSKPYDILPQFYFKTILILARSFFLIYSEISYLMEKIQG